MNPTHVTLQPDRGPREFGHWLATAWSRLWASDLHREQYLELARMLDNRTLRDIGLCPLAGPDRR